MLKRTEKELIQNLLNGKYSLEKGTGYILDSDGCRLTDHGYAFDLTEFSHDKNFMKMAIKSGLLTQLRKGKLSDFEACYDTAQCFYRKYALYKPNWTKSRKMILLVVEHDLYWLFNIEKIPFFRRKNFMIKAIDINPNAFIKSSYPSIVLDAKVQEAYVNKVMTTAKKMLSEGYSKQELQKYIDEKEDAAIEHISTTYLFSLNDHILERQYLAEKEDVAVKHIKKYIQGYKEEKENKEELDGYRQKQKELESTFFNEMHTNKKSKNEESES